MYSFHTCKRDKQLNICKFKLSFGTEIGTENREFLLVLVPNTEILVPWQHYFYIYTTIKMLGVGKIFLM